ncbi:LOW QUALITY PROTEIN: Protein CBG20244 [Caenorhabditis briggsae]|uniref:Protein CBG20244 n=1 Tax=Caenorhabditis briggsae TaxID=6238 RepID=A8XXF0_CAEBR|nr:LOW QUALITY PROTEIN: Protein CBG20244 [Caenorhabditis briggsae]CAP37339.1 Protein CBG20244 [Caenorhabditis briggsae]
MRDHSKPDHHTHDPTKTFEDAAFEMLSTVSPVKVSREDIPFDSVRQIVLGEILKSKQRAAKPNTSNGRRRTMDELLDEAPSSSSSSSHVGESSSSILERGTMTDDGESSGTPRPIVARLYGDHTRSSSTSTSSVIPCGSSEATDTKKKPLNYREKRLAEIRGARMKKYRESAEIVEFKCEEIELKEEFLKFYEELLEDDAPPSTVYYRVVESLDCYFRAKTWESNCPKLLCEFLCEHILKTCQELNVLNEASSATDEWKAREIQIQVLLTLHVYVVTDKRKWLDEAINKMRMIFISVGPEKLKTFVEEPVTDIFLELIGDGLATIYDELCIQLPADLLQYNSGLFKMTETDDNIVVKRRNGAANRLEAMLIETSDNLGIGGVEKTTSRQKTPEATAPTKRRSLKRKNEESVPKELLSPARPTRSASVGRPDYKHFFVEDTPDEKYTKRKSVEEVNDDDLEDGEDEVKVTRMKKRITIKEEIDEEVKQTPVAKLRAVAASKSGKRCSRRLSEMVKLSEERSQIPKKARENLNKILEKAKTPSRTVTRPTRKSVLFGTSPASTSMTKKTGSSRKSLLNRFIDAEDRRSPDSELTVDTSGGHDIDSPSESLANTPVLRERSTRKRPSRFRHSISDSRPDIDDDDEVAPSAPSTSKRTFSKSAASSAATTPTATTTTSSTKWTDRQLKRQLGLTREDLNRYRNAMLTTGERNQNKNVKINWESAQVNRAGRVKGAGASENGTPIFGILRRNVRTMICHVLLNDTNPDTSFNWNKVKFDDLDDKPRTRQFQSLIQKPEAFMESLKQKYIEKRSMPLKRMRSNATSSADLTPSTSTSPSRKKHKPPTSSAKNSPKKRNPTSSTRGYSEEYDLFGFETEADD